MTAFSPELLTARALSLSHASARGFNILADHHRERINTLVAPSLPSSGHDLAHALTLACITPPDVYFDSKRQLVTVNGDVHFSIPQLRLVLAWASRDLQIVEEKIRC